jgi:hypothetical protein
LKKAFMVPRNVSTGQFHKHDDSPDLDGRFCAATLIPWLVELGVINH